LGVRKSFVFYSMLTYVYSHTLYAGVVLGAHGHLGVVQVCKVSESPMYSTTCYCMCILILLGAQGHVVAVMANAYQRLEDWYTLQHTATHCNTLQHTATHCDTLQHTATHCNTLRHTATHCDALQHTATHCHTLRRTATHCNTLQHTATHYNTPQHTARGLLNIRLQTSALLLYSFYCVSSTWQCADFRECFLCCGAAL